MKMIPLAGKHAAGKFALVSDEDYPRLAQFSWHAYPPNKRGQQYAQRTIVRPDGRCTKSLMHREVLGLQPGDPRQADHKDQSQTLNNQRENLRVSNKSQNQANIRVFASSSSGYKGVFLFRERWRADISEMHRHIVLGDFDCKEEAAYAYNIAAKELRGEFAALNEIPSQLLPNEQIRREIEVIVHRRLAVRRSPERIVQHSTSLLDPVS